MFNIDPVIYIPTVIAAVVTDIFFGVPIKLGLLWVWRKITNQKQTA